MSHTRHRARSDRTLDIRQPRLPIPTTQTTAMYSTLSLPCRESHASAADRAWVRVPPRPCARSRASMRVRPCVCAAITHHCVAGVSTNGASAAMRNGAAAARTRHEMNCFSSAARHTSSQSVSYIPILSRVTHSHRARSDRTLDIRQPRLPIPTTQTTAMHSGGKGGGSEGAGGEGAREGDDMREGCALAIERCQ